MKKERKKERTREKNKKKRKKEIEDVPLEKEMAVVYTNIS